jgi:putative CocE/NonD family hydrolase
MPSETSPVEERWGVRIPLRDGVELSANVYLPGGESPSPAVLTLTPYIAQSYHDRGLYFASQGYPFVVADVRGRGNSAGAFRPFSQESRDAFDAVEWTAEQPFCNGRVAMWGGSYAGYVQWAAASQKPPHLATIVPVASPYFGVDFPGRSNRPLPYLMQWLRLVWGRTSQEGIFWQHEPYWAQRFRTWFESGASFAELDRHLGQPSEIFQEWVAHPQQDAYWDSYNPNAEQYSGMTLPVLTITGIYDDDQPGALMHYRQHLRACDSASKTHYLVIGPWDHAGTRTPQTEFAGLRVNRTSVLDLNTLHREWYGWTMLGGPRPEFLKDRVAYYLMGAEEWCYAESLQAVTEKSAPWFLRASVNPTDVFRSGSLTTQEPPSGGPDHYVHDPRDIRLAELESQINSESRVEQRMTYAASGRQLVYHSAPFEKNMAIAGFFRLVAWLAIDQPDCDFLASVYEIEDNGEAVLLSTDSIRARYRESLREEKLISTTDPLRYDFERFTFVARLVKKGSRLRLIVGPVHSIYAQKNYNSGGVVAHETERNARPVCVRLFHDAVHPSVLYVPYRSNASGPSHSPL